MTKKELFELLKDVHEDAWVNIALHLRNDNYRMAYIGQIYHEPECAVPPLFPGDKKEFIPGRVTICPQGHEVFDDYPLPVLPQTHPDANPDEERVHPERILYDSTHPDMLTPPKESPLESEKQWPIYRSTSIPRTETT